MKCDLLFGFCLMSWTEVDLMTHTHTHRPISTLLDKQQMQTLLYKVIVIHVNLRLGCDINSSAAHRLHMYTFARPVCVPVDSELVGAMPCLTWFRLPCLPSLKTWQQGLRGCLSLSTVVRSLCGACLSSKGSLRLNPCRWARVEGLHVYSDEYVLTVSY